MTNLCKESFIVELEGKRPLGTSRLMWGNIYVFDLEEIGLGVSLDSSVFG
jgi:hypothetical protein